MKLRTKISLMLICCTIVSVLLVGGIAIYNELHEAKENARQELLSKSENLAKDMDITFSCIETGVNTIAVAAVDEIHDLDRFKRDKVYVEQCTNNLKQLALNCAINVDGTMTYYIRYNPDFAEPTSGIFGGRNKTTDKFALLPCTDFSIYPKDDFAHVGWYYIPVNNGKPTWMNPYMNANLNVYMISYVVPLFAKDGTSVGIAGMDVNFTNIQEKVAGIKVHQNGYALLVNSSNEVLAGPKQQEAKSLADISSGLDKYVGRDTADRIFSFEENGVSYLAGYAVLHNGMKYVMVVPEAEITQNARSLVWILLAVMAVVTLVCVLGGFFFSGRLVAPLQELEAKTTLMAQGDLTVSLDITREDEIGSVARAFNNLSERLSEVIGRIAEAADQVASGSKNISDSGSLLASGAATQASSVEELSASIAEINAKTADTASNATEANKLTTTAKQMAQTGNQRMGELVKAIDDISTSSKNISKIIKAIDEIAFQTNILALNAAVEAARAGQHGKGFAVVAEEVGNLAARSAKAAKETSDIIEGSLGKIDAGTKLAKDTAQELEQIETEIIKVSDYVSEIATASQQQSSALNMLNSGVLQVSGVVQSNSSTAEESAAASEKLSEQARTLQEVISKFKV